MSRLLETVKTGLGIEDKLSVKASLFKLLVYEKDGHFKPHRDSEKEQNMFGTLVVQLPSQYSGGKVKVSLGAIQDSFFCILCRLFAPSRTSN